MTTPVLRYCPVHERAAARHTKANHGAVATPSDPEHRCDWCRERDRLRADIERRIATTPDADPYGDGMD
jgi:hypothetical protein